ncbi:MAG: type II toxin-antitoxin system VapC family toxin [Alphaproteobacteria bacterium]|nr:type II toxin-antitoxin system VapC family toxin [Alphaproteobacteria bacterium]
MTMVIDASVIMPWYVASTHTAAALALRDRSPRPVAPDLVFAEVGNALWRTFRLGVISVEQGRAALAALPRALAAIIPTSELVDRAFRLATDLDHPIYDCVYLALAERDETQMATLDRRLVRRVSGTRWANLVMPLAAA